MFQDLNAEVESGSRLVLGHQKVRVGGDSRRRLVYLPSPSPRDYRFDLLAINTGAWPLSRDFAGAVDIKHRGMMVNPEPYATAKNLGFTITGVSVGHEPRHAGGTSHLSGKRFSPWGRPSSTSDCVA